MKKFAIPVSIFALLVIGGGCYGFFKAHSMASLIMSLIFGMVLLCSSYGIRKEVLPSLYVAAFTTLALHLFFLYRFFKTFKLMPAGMMVLLSTALGAPLLAYLTKRIKETVYQK